MAGAFIPGDGYGVVDWTNYQDNWRDEDASWLQSHSILRFANTTDRDTAYPTPLPGTTVYVNTGAGVLQWYGSDSNWRTVLSPVYLTNTEDSTSSTFAYGANAPVLAIKNGSVELGPSPASLTVSSAGLTVKTGSNTTLLTTDTTGLVANGNIKAATFSSTGLATFNSLSVTTTLNVTTTSTFAGLLTAQNGLSVTSGTAAFGAVTATGITVTSGTVSAATLTSTGNISAAGYALGGVAKISTNSGAQFSSTAGTGTVTLTDSNTDSVALSGKAFTLKTQTVGAVQVQIAGVYFSSTDPGVANVPEGTLWINTGVS